MLTSLHRFPIPFQTTFTLFWLLTAPLQFLNMPLPVHLAGDIFYSIKVALIAHAVLSACLLQIMLNPWLFLKVYLSANLLALLSFMSARTTLDARSFSMARHSLIALDAYVFISSL
jgi:hypothetical protein